MVIGINGVFTNNFGFIFLFKFYWLIYTYILQNKFFQMNFDKAVQGALDTLKFGKDMKRGKELPFTYTDFFAEKSSIIETLGLSWRQRLGCVVVSGILSFFFLAYSIIDLWEFIFRPEKFGWHYAMFCIFSIIAVGFLSGFKTLFLNAFSKEMVAYTTFLIANTALIFLCKNWSLFVKVPISLLEVCIFLLFIYTYFTFKFRMGLKGLSSFSIF